jgi:ferredoxin
MAPKEAAAPEVLEFFVDKDACIGCVACAEVFPDIFKMVGDKALAYEKAQAGVVRPTKVLKTCPTDAIKLIAGTMDSGEEEVQTLEMVVGWEAEWEKHKNDNFDLLERERRYGRVTQLLEEDKGWILRIELPTSVPNHPLIYRYGIKQEPPEYEYTVEQIAPRTLRVKARLADPKLRFLTGKLNSFPNNFKLDYRFPAPIGAMYKRQYVRGIEIYAFQEGVVDSDRHLRNAMLKQVA